MKLWKKVKINYKLIKEFAKWGYVLAAALIVFTVAVIRASTASITCDEAYTYIFYIDNIDIFKFSQVKEMLINSIANNHLLNTLLGNILIKITNVSWNDFLIRLPNLIFFGGYLAVAVLLVYKKKIGLVAYSFLLFNYHLNEFFSLARGYGMATCIVLVAIVMYEEWRKSEGKQLGYLSLFLFFLTLAVTANTIVLFIMAAFAPYVIYRMVKEKTIVKYLFKHFAIWIPIGLVCIGMVLFHFYVSESGKPLFYAEDETFYSSVIKSYVAMLLSGDLLIKLTTIVTGCFVFAGVISIILNNNFFNSKYVIPMVIYILLLLLSKYGLNKGYPTSRVLLPAFPLLVFAFIEMKDNIKFYLQRQKNKGVPYLWKASRIAGIFLIIFLAFSFKNKISFTKYNDWYFEEECKNIAYDSMTNPDSAREKLKISDYPIIYYREKILEEDNFDIYSGERVD